MRTTSSAREHVAAEREAGDGQDGVADAQPLDARAEGRDATAALGAQGHTALRQAGIQAQRLHDITEVEAGGADLDLDLARTPRPPLPHMQDQAIQGAGPAGHQPIGHSGLCGSLRVAESRPRGGLVAVDVSLRPAPGDFIFLIRDREFLEQGGDAPILGVRVQVHQPAAQAGILPGDDPAQPDDGRLGDGHRLGLVTD
jgi:hypothetical protein